MGRMWVLTVVVLTVLELFGVMGYVPEPLPTYRPLTQGAYRPSPLSTHTPEPQRTRRPAAHTRKPLKPRISQQSSRDESAIYFPESEPVDDSRQHTGSKRSLPDAPARYSDIYPQTQLFNAERQAARDDQPAAHGPQNPWGNPQPQWGNPQPQWGNPGVNNSPRRPQNRPNAFPSNQPSWGGGGNQQGWGNGGGNFNEDYEERPFVFDRPPANGGGNRPQPGNGGVNRPQPGNGGNNRPQPGNGGVNRPQPGNGGVNRPRPGNNVGVNRPQPGNGAVNRPQPGNGGGGARPRPTTRPTAPATRAPTTPRATAAPTTPRATTAPTTTRRPPGAPVTMPTPAPTRAGCNCPSTPEFNPVCGQDRVTYTNPGKLRCANACGNRVMMLHFGSCVTTTTPTPSR